MKRKKQILWFVYDGFHDYETSLALARLTDTNQFAIRTIAMDKGTKQSSSGLSVLPDLDFIPEVDLKDLDAFNTAMLILPGGKPLDEKTKYKILMLLAHCFDENIPAVASKEILVHLSVPQHHLSVYRNGAECSRIISDTLAIQDDGNVLTNLQYEGIMFG